MTGCGTFQLAKLLGAITRLRKAARAVKEHAFDDKTQPPPTPQLCELADALDRVDQLFGPLA